MAKGRGGQASEGILVLTERWWPQGGVREGMHAIRWWFLTLGTERGLEALSVAPAKVSGGFPDLFL